MAKDHYHGPLEEIGCCCYRIPKSYKPGMRVEGRIFASEKLLDAVKKDQAPEQVANVATLPGIQLASIAMPDIHWGYGFCIGGVCATDPEEDGVISPGGIGYDINCLTGDSLILNDHGYTRTIEDMASVWADARLACFNLKAARPDSTRVALWFHQRPKKPVLRVTTEAGDEIKATADHPFWTPDGMLPSGCLEPGDRVAISPFQGVPWQEPSQKVILTETNFRATWEGLGPTDKGDAFEKALASVKQSGLLPLRYDSPAIPWLCKVLGFISGGGSIQFGNGIGQGVVRFDGEPEDLEQIRSDIVVLGFTPSQVQHREGHLQIETDRGEFELARDEHYVEVVGDAFAVMLAALGAPVGNKTNQNFSVPAWLDEAPLWQKRLFLASLSGAEMTTPAIVSGERGVFAAPTISVNKRSEYIDSGRAYLAKVSDWLNEFGVVTEAIQERTGPVDQDGEDTIRLRLILSPHSENLINLWSRVGYVYHRKSSSEAAIAVQYLKQIERQIEQRSIPAEHAQLLLGQSVPRIEVIAQPVSAGVNEEVLEQSSDENLRTRPRFDSHRMSYEDYRSEATQGIEGSGMVWERIASIAEIPDFQGEVFDFSVKHDDHNFVANGFVVSNCGVRLIRSNLSIDDVKPHLRNLVKELFYTIPAGVGRSGKYKFTESEMKPLLEQGPSFVLGRGLGVPRDLEYTEANGRIDDADPDAVSKHAVRRGTEQCGTLGSGNHFLELQVVDHIFDEEVAAVFGLEKDMVCVMIHSGSRGLGYQVCDDGLAKFRNLPAKYGFELPDRQLACAPVYSPEGREYIAAMRSAANFGFCNRQLLMMQAREVFAKVFSVEWEELGMDLVYDVAHNIAKLEEHTIEGVKKKVWVHRKGATRAFPAGHPEIPEKYRAVGQPVIIPGDMGRASWVLVGAPGSMEKTFGTTCHGAGRAMSRTAAVKEAGSRKIDKELESRGVIAMASSRKGLAEEQPKAYKNVDDVVEVVHMADLSRKVARMRPIGVIKG